ncbi:hypothetical protein BST61_g5049 [Cercospora zeina]
MLAGITPDADTAEKYLRDARETMEMYKQERPQPDPRQGDIDGMTGDFDELSQDIQKRREQPWEEPAEGDDDEDDEVETVEADIRAGIPRILPAYKYGDLTAGPQSSSGVKWTDLPSMQK